MPTTAEKIDALIALYRASRFDHKSVQVGEYLTVFWDSGARHYSFQQLDDEMGFDEAIENKINLDSFNDKSVFQNLTQASVLIDSSVSVKFTDEDEAIFDLFRAEENGVGTRATVNYWFPDVDLKLEVWRCHIENIEPPSEGVTVLKFANGFRSSNFTIPRHKHYREPCQAIYPPEHPELTLEEIYEKLPCKYTRHLPGGTFGALIDGQPVMTCPKRFIDCGPRWTAETASGRHIPFYAHHSTQEGIVNNQTKGPNLIAQTKSNESDLDDPVRVVMGGFTIRGLKVLAFRRETNTNNPERGFFAAEFEACHGPVRRIQYLRILNGNPQAVQFNNGTFRQPASSFSPNAFPYSMIAKIFARYGWVNPDEVQPGDIPTQAGVEGLNDIRVYTTETAFTNTWTDTRAWHLLRMWCDPVWGYADKEANHNIAGYLECANLYEWVEFTDPKGTLHKWVRGHASVDLSVARTAQQQIEDYCWPAAYTRPFMKDGKINMFPMRALTTEEIAALPVFSDDEDEADYQILRDKNGRSSLKIAPKDEYDLPNRIELTFYDGDPRDDAGNVVLDQINQAATVTVEDEALQFRQGKVNGQLKRVNTKQYSAPSVVQKGHANCLAWRILDLGINDEPGLKNNCPIKFKTYFLNLLKLHPFGLIKVKSKKLAKYEFEIFRIHKIGRNSDLTCTVECLPHPNEVVELYDGTPTTPPTPPGGGGGESCKLTLGTVSYNSDGNLVVPIEECA